MLELALKNLRPGQIYRNLYPWKTRDEFLEHLKSTLSYRSEDNSLLAICKPFGVGVHTVQDLNQTKQNQDNLRYKLNGQPKYCIDDVLEPLASELGSERPFQVIKSLDRYMSGLILLTNDPEKYKAALKRSAGTTRVNKVPHIGLRAITSGYPVIRPGSQCTCEKVGIELIEVDELGDHKEAIIVNEPSKRFSKRHRSDVEDAQVELSIKKINKSNSTSLVELYVSKLKYDFPRVYMTSKTAFILGDVHFSKRIRNILGQPIQVSAFKSSHLCEDGFEPLSNELRKLLGVHKNANIPLMLDCHVLRLQNFLKRTKKDPEDFCPDLIIQSEYMPPHFAATAEKLELLEADLC